MVPTVAFIGEHNVGKTTLMEGVVRVLRREGLRVGVIKSTKEPRGETDREGTDTYRLREAGAHPVALWAGEEWVFYTEAPLREEFWGMISRYFASCDLVLAEGFKGLTSVPKIEVLRKGHTRKFWFEELSGVVALAADFRPPTSLPLFDLQDFFGLAAFIRERFVRPRPYRVSLLVDGQPVALNRYVRRALSGLLRGFLESLRGVPESPVRIEIFLED